MSRVNRIRPSKNARTKQGYYKLKNPDKYRGNDTSVVYRSSWELELYKRCDVDPAVLSWKAEPYRIPYNNPVTKRTSHYIPDALIVLKASDGTQIVYLVEVKPESQTKRPTKPRVINASNTSKYKRQAMTYAINLSKFAAAQRFCKNHRMVFKVMTDKFFGNKNKL